MFNQATLVGNAGKDPELRYTQGGTAIAKFSLATSYGLKKPDGTWENKTTWHNIVVFGKMAEGIASRIRKGDPVLVVGRIENDEWTGQDGQKRRTTQIIADTLRGLGPKRDPATPAAGRPTNPVAEPTAAHYEAADSDVPF